MIGKHSLVVIMPVIKKVRELRMERHPLFCGGCKKLIKPKDRNGTG